MNEKVLVIGIDAATFDLLKPWMKEGKLPNLFKIVNSGVSGELMSPNPVNSAIAWTSFFTGKNAGKHGVFAFTERRLGSYDISPVNSKNRSVKSIWSILSEEAKKVGVINVPFTYPPEEVNGFIISGLMTPPQESNFTYPSSIFKELEDKIGEYRIYAKEVYKPGNEDAYLEDLYFTLKKREKVTFYLMKTYDWDFFMTVFYYTDQIQHWFWKYMDRTHPQHDPIKGKEYGNAILKFYQKIDDIIEELINNVDDETTIIVMSDHGAGPLYKKVYWNNWLLHIGLLKLKKRKEISYSLYSMFKFGYIMATIKKISLMARLLKHLKRKIPKKILSIIPGSYPKLSDVDWSKTKVWVEGARININLKGREPNGIVDSGIEYEELRDYIINEMCKVKDPETKKKIVYKVSKREELFWGKYVDKAPDLIIKEWNENYMNMGDFGEDIFSTPTNKSCRHRRNGILMMKGPNIKEGVEIKNAEIIDLASTILYLMGLPIPSDMDGRVLAEVFESGFLKKNPVRSQDIKTKKIYEESAIERHKKY